MNSEEVVKKFMASTDNTSEDCLKNNIDNEFDNVLKNINVDSLTDKILNNTDSLLEEYNNLREDIPANIRQKLENTARGPIGKQLRNKLQQSGKSPQQLLKEQKKAKKEHNKELQKNKVMQDIKEHKIIMLHNRKFTEKKVNSLEHEFLSTLIKRSCKDDVVTSYCYNMQIGPLEDSDIYAWYDSKNNSVDRIAKILTGKNVGGKILLTTRGDLHKKDVETVLKILKGNNSELL